MLLEAPELGVQMYVRPQGAPRPRAGHCRSSHRHPEDYQHLSHFTEENAWLQEVK